MTASPLRRALLSLCLVSSAHAIDTTPPTLNIPQTWIEKTGSVFHFMMNLDPQDNVGVDKIEFRSALNSTAALPANMPWDQYAWNPGQSFDIGFICSSVVIEIRAKDSAGNVSPLQRRTFKAPFPITAAPNLDPMFGSTPLTFTSTSLLSDFRGLFTADFDGLGRDDLLQIDNSTGLVKIRRQLADGTFTSNGFTVPAGTIQDSAIGDFDHDGRMDIILVLNHDLMVYHNDGLDVNGTLQFTGSVPPGRLNSEISVVEHVAVQDFNGDDFPEVVIVGTGDDGSGGTVMKMEMMANDGAGSIHGHNSSLGPTGASAGRIAIGDLTADGIADVAMVDHQGARLVVFKGLGNGVFGGMDDVTVANRPLLKSSYFQGETLAIGDLEGTGHNGVIMTQNYYGQIPLPPYDDSQNHNAQFWQWFAYDPASILTAQLPEYLAVGPASGTNTPAASDVMIRDYTGDRFPEIVMTSEHEAGVRTVRMTVPLNNQNLRFNGYKTSVRTFPTAAHPQRLCAGRLNGATKDGLVVAGDGAPNKVTWLSNTFTNSVKANDIVGGASTDSDASGSPDGIGGLSYTVFPNGQINYSLTYLNNTTTAIMGATVECLLPSTLSFISGSAGNTVTASGTSHYVRWTVDIPANSAGVETFSAQVLTATANTVIAPTASLKKGTAVLASTTLPKVTVLEPLRFTLGVSSDSNSSGDTTHKDEAIKYTFTVRNAGTTPVTNVKPGMLWPAGTSYLNVSSVQSGITYAFRGTIAKPTGVDWTIASLPAGGIVSVFVLVNVIAAENAIITASTPACKRGAIVITAPPFKTTVLPTLGVELSSDKTIARPGDFINYEFTVHNYGTGVITNAKLVDLLPQGMALSSAFTDDGTGNFISGALNGDNLTSTTNPGIDRTLGVMTWTWASIPGHLPSAPPAQRTVRFTCQVKFDDPTYYLSGSTSVTNSVSNLSYNFVGTPGSGTRLFAAKAIGGSAASSATALSPLLLSIVVPKAVSLLSGGEPLSPPALALQKSAVADGQQIIAGEAITTVINDTTNGADGIVTYVLAVSNPAGAGTATNVQIHDFIPTGTTFIGFVARDGSFVPSYFGFHFYDSAGAEIFGTGATRSFTFPVGNLAGGQTVSFSYKVQNTLAPGGVLISNSGGMAGKSSIYTFDPVIGYHLTASNLNFPTNGGPRQLKVIVTSPAAFNLPAGIIRSRGESTGSSGELTGIAIPLEVLGAAGVNLSGIKMDIPIPKGFLASAAQLFNSLGNVVATATPSAPNSSGVRTLSFAVGALRNATALFQVALDPATSSILKNASGQIVAPLAVKPVVTGNYAKGTVASTLTPSVMSFTSATVATAAPATTPIVPLTTGLGVLQFRPDPIAKDAKVFVARYAPAVVRRGENITYTIVVGNLSNTLIFGARINMSLPAGTTYVSSTHYVYNFRLSGDIDSGPVAGGNLPDGIYSGGKVSWNIGGLSDSEVGVVTMTVKVPDTFVGDRITDNTCNFDLTNGGGKSPGPIGTTVLSGNQTAQSSTATQSAIEGLGSKFTDDLRISLGAQSFHVGSTSYNVTTGGCDIMHLRNDVVLIPLASNRIVVIGPNDKVSATGIRLLVNGAMRVAAGPGTLGGNIGVGVNTLPGLGAVPLVTPNSILIGLSTNSLVATGGGNLVATGGGNLVATGGGNLVATGGGNLVATGGGNLIGNDGATLTGANAARLLLPEGTASLLATSSGGRLVATGGGNLVATGGGNLVATGGGNLVATGGGNLIGNDGATLIGQDGAGLIAAGAGNLIGQDGAGVIAAGADNLVATGGGNLVNLNGVSSLANQK